MAVDSNLKIPFPFQRAQIFDLDDRLAFWNAPDTIRFFEDHGYILYRRILKNGYVTCATTPVMPPPVEFMDADYPYASHDSKLGRTDPLLAEDIRGKVVFAQDSLGRHVAIKLVRDNTDEHRILQFLHQQPLELLQENCVVPILDLLPIEGFWFAVMPRWGGSVRHPQANTILDVLDIVHAMLKGLSFLHKRNITHGDINDENVLVNHFCDSRIEGQCSVRWDLRSRRQLSYALFDFDFSMMFPPDMDRTHCRLSYDKSWGTFCMVHDTAQGEFDYDPFIFDVGNMGVVFCDLCQHLTPAAPFLAPLLDRMTTRDLERRFTAYEALRFFEEMFSQMSETQLKTPYWVKESEVYLPFDEYDRWKDLPSDFVNKWSSYREPPIPLLTKFLRWLCGPEWAHHVIAYIRWFAYSLVSMPTGVFSTHLVGLRLSGWTPFIQRSLPF
ncbi:kinase-like domain-containing protein [Gymnopilus junonius]|uniref:Kinase-like domain-containing protein n=1 Tax=Gymnopilus junonius TaxID=109634 RepID=A0A9P5NBL6_GYMJU|nr:kinase-like domain-containing protein [Gymnopilus junonius]